MSVNELYLQRTLIVMEGEATVSCRTITFPHIRGHSQNIKVTKGGLRGALACKVFTDHCPVHFTWTA